MAEQPLSSDHEAASVLSAPAQRAPPDVPRARRRPWSGITLVRLAVLIAAGVIVVLFATQWDRWIGLAVRQVTDDCLCSRRHHAAERAHRGLCAPRPSG